MKYKAIFTLALVFMFLPFSVDAAILTSAPKPKLEVSGWIPYWRKATGTADALLHIDAFTEINPFGYTVKNDGTLADTAKMDEEPWTTLITEAKKRKILLMPTAM